MVSMTKLDFSFTLIWDVLFRAHVTLYEIFLSEKRAQFCVNGLKNLQFTKHNCLMVNVTAYRHFVTLLQMYVQNQDRKRLLNTKQQVCVCVG